MLEITKQNSDGYATIYSDEKFKIGDVIETDQGAYVVLNYYRVKDGIEYNSWSEVQYLKGKRLS